MWTMAMSQLALAAVLALVGWWGRRNAAVLTRDRRRVAVLRRGGLACQFVALLFALATIPGLV